MMLPSGFKAKDLKTTHPKLYAEIIELGKKETITAPDPSALQAEYSKGYEAGKLAGAAEERSKQSKTPAVHAPIIEAVLAQNPGLTPGQAAVKIVEETIRAAERDQAIIAAAVENVNAQNGRARSSQSTLSPMHAADSKDAEIVDAAAAKANGQR
jgi:hypothetical protein